MIRTLTTIIAIALLLTISSVTSAAPLQSTYAFRDLYFPCDSTDRVVQFPNPYGQTIRIHHILMLANVDFDAPTLLYANVIKHPGYTPLAAMKWQRSETEPKSHEQQVRLGDLVYIELGPTDYLDLHTNCYFRQAGLPINLASVEVVIWYSTGDLYR